MIRLVALVLSCALLLVPAVPEAAIITYSAATGAYTPPATPSDTATICGSATKTVRVLSAKISGLQTTAGVNRFTLLKRSTADTAGTFVASTLVLHDSGDVTAATATTGHYTANPTTGSLVGNLRSDLVFNPSATSAAGPVVHDFLQGYDLSAGEFLTLRGTGECLAVNFGGVALPAGSSWSAEWTWREE